MAHRVSYCEVGAVWFYFKITTSSIIGAHELLLRFLTAFVSHNAESQNLYFVTTNMIIAHWNLKFPYDAISTRAWINNYQMILQYVSPKAT